MFTSRAEYRILLRQDNADLRLTAKSHAIGLADDFRYELTMKKYDSVSKLIDFCDDTNIKPEDALSYLESVGSTPLIESKKISELVTRPELNLDKLLSIVPRRTFEKSEISLPVHEDVIQAAEIEIKYKGYIERERKLAEKLTKLENLLIPEGFDFDKVSSLTIECRQKLKRYAPKTIAQASRISGVSPADISVLLVYFGR